MRKEKVVQPVVIDRVIHSNPSVKRILSLEQRRQAKRKNPAISIGQPKEAAHHSVGTETRSSNSTKMPSGAKPSRAKNPHR